MLTIPTSHTELENTLAPRVCAIICDQKQTHNNGLSSAIACLIINLKFHIRFSSFNTDDEDPPIIIPSY